MSLEKLKELTHKLPPLKIMDRSGDTVEYSVMANGECLGVGLYRNKDVAVQKIFMSKGARLELHGHRETEYGIMYKGSIKMVVDGKEHIIKQNQCIRIPSSKTHTAHTLEDSWMIWITIPASEDYPDASPK